MRDCSKPAAMQPRFIFRPKYDRDDGKNYRVGVAQTKADEYGITFCDVGRIGDKGEWQVEATQPDQYLAAVRHVRFGSKEEAALFVYLLRQRCEEVTTARPLPEDVTRYLEDRAEKLRTEQAAALAEFRRVQHDRFMLDKFAARHGLERVAWRTEDSDPEAAVRRLLEFKVHVKKEKGEVPLFSETALYTLIGKEDARTVRGLLERVCNRVAPNVTQELM